MKKLFLLLLLLLFLCDATTIAQSDLATPTQGLSRKSSAQEATSLERPNFQTDSYRLTVESLHRKANNFTVTLIIESLSDKVTELRLGGDSYYWEKNGPYLIDEKSNKYILQDKDSEGVVNGSGNRLVELFPKTKLKTQLLFFGSGNGTTFTFVTTEIAPVRGRPVLIKGLKITSAESFNDEAKFTTESYRVTVESVKKNADNVEVTLVIESLSNDTVILTWGEKYNNEVWQMPYLTDENADKYILRVRKDPETEDDSNEPAVSQTELLPGTKLKTHLKFYGTGRGTTFTLVSKERSPKSGRPVVISGLKPNAVEPPKKASMEESPSINTPTTETLQPPTFETESYRVVVSDVQRNAGDIIVTLIFENLTDKTFQIGWGRGQYRGDGIRVWEGEEPYLIDENADRYYLRDRDNGKVVDCMWCESAELLPGTKLKTRFIFKASGNGTTFTLACKEFSPKPERPIVIRGLKVK